MIMKNIDRQIGSRIKLQRKNLNMSQYALSYDLNISFQQVQKYESGKNRVSASRIYEISKILQVSPNFFFEGLDDKIKTPHSCNTLKISQIIEKIQNQKVKDKIISLLIELKT